MDSAEQPDMTKVKTPDEAIRESDEPDGVAEMLEKATNYIKSFRWCREVVEQYVGFAIPGVVGVFLFHILPEGPDVDEWVWVVVDDVPPAYISPIDAPTPAEALEGYIREMDRWLEAVREGRSTEDLIPVTTAVSAEGRTSPVQPTAEFADMLDSRLRFLEREILSDPAWGR